jgi:hypothetical protein
MTFLRLRPKLFCFSSSELLGQMETEPVLQAVSRQLKCYKCALFPLVLGRELNARLLLSLDYTMFYQIGAGAMLSKNAIKFPSESFSP